MKKKWKSIALILGLVTVSTAVAAAIIIYNKISYDVLSYSVRSINSKGVTIRVYFAVRNDSSVNLDIWNQEYEVYVSGNKISTIISFDRYKMRKGLTTIVPLDVKLLWDELKSDIQYIGGQLQVNTLASLPVFVKGRLSVKSGIVGLKKFPIRWRTYVSEFLP